MEETISKTDAETVTASKSDLTINFWNYLDDPISGRNQKGKNYAYGAVLSDYQTVKEINRTFFEGKSVECDYDTTFIVSKNVVNGWNVNDVIELSYNEKASKKYSYISKNFFVVIDNNEDDIVLKKYPSAYTAFKSLMQKKSKKVSL